MSGVAHRLLAALGLVAFSAALLAGCGSGAAAIGSTLLDLPVAAPKPLTSTTVYTSPDGGIYRNPVHLDILMVARRDVSALAGRLGGGAAGWSELRRFGGFTLVAIRLRNEGKAWSEPELRDLQIASDFAPPGTASGPLRHWYHPTYTLAAVADRPMSGECQPHLDPGQAITVVLVYPPVAATGSIVWGRYQDYALRVPFGGGVGQIDAKHLHATLCPAPVPPP
jgi:hypothetical protein